MPETHVSCRHSSVRLSHHPDNNDATGAGGGAAGRRQCVFVNPPAAVDWSVGRSSGERRSLAPLPCSSPTSTVHPTPPPLPTYPSLPLPPYLFLQTGINNATDPHHKRALENIIAWSNVTGNLYIFISKINASSERSIIINYWFFCK